MTEVRIISGSAPAEVVSHLDGGVFVLYDAAVAPAAGEIINALPHLKWCMGLEVSERAKCMDTVLEICRRMLEAGVGRDDTLLCVGGGITSDIGGFAASIYKRGIAYANVPTTLLSQVDAGIGGKNGVNFGGCKNMLGTIVQPLFTFICPAFLNTLPRREMLCGIAEMLKTFLIADAALYEEAVTVLTDESMPEVGPVREGLSLSSLVLKAAEIKAEIVREDPYEKGRRTVLNFGHTYAHAIESVAAVKGDDIAHGEAVAMGMILAAGYGDRLNGTALEPRLRSDFTRIGLPVDCPYAMDELAPYMANDKKGRRLVLLRDIGKPWAQMIDY